jgi:hypothetical protein
MRVELICFLLRMAKLEEIRASRSALAASSGPTFFLTRRPEK